MLLNECDLLTETEFLAERQPEETVLNINLKTIIDNSPDQDLYKFLASSINLGRKLQNLSKSYVYITYKMDGFTNVVPIYEDISPLACIALCGNVSHVKAVLSPSLRNLSALLKSDSKELIQARQEAFFRALESKNIEVAKFLLEYPDVLQAARIFTIDGIIASQETDHYLNKLVARHRHIMLMNGIKAEGNLALFLAAQSGDSDLFNCLLNEKEIKAQLPKTAILAFLSMTKRVNAETVELDSINIKIVSKLLDIPSVYSYAQRRSFDFEEIVALYNKNKATLCTLEPIKFFDNRLRPIIASPDTTVSSPVPTVYTPGADANCSTPNVY